MYKRGFYLLLLVVIGYVSVFVFNMKVQHDAAIQQKFIGQEITGFDIEGKHVTMRTRDRIFLFGEHDCRRHEDNDIRVEELFTGEKRERLWQEIALVGMSDGEVRIITSEGGTLVIGGELEEIVERKHKGSEDEK